MSKQENNAIYLMLHLMSELYSTRGAEIYTNVGVVKPSKPSRSYLLIVNQ